jgi:hypothetical protein
MENFLEPTNSLNSKKIQSSDFICSTSGWEIIWASKGLFQMAQMRAHRADI